MANDFKDKFKGTMNPNLKDTKVVVEGLTSDNDVIDNSFSLKKKTDDKKGKKVFNVYIDPDKLKELDKTCKRSGYSRNELVNIMIDYCLDNLKLEE